MRAHIVALLAIALVFGFTPPAPVATAQVGGGEHDVQGIVCSTDWYDYYPQPGNYCKGQGLPGATVTVSKAGALPGGLGDVNKSATTDQWGNFYIGGLGAGEHDLRIERAGFTTLTGKVDPAVNEYLERSLEGAQVTATGVVETPSGQAISGATLSFEAGGDRWKTTTGSSGSFSVQVRGGFHTVLVQHEDHHGLRVWNLLVDGQEALEFELKPAPERNVVLRGLIEDQQGTPVAGANVEIWQYQDCCYVYETHAEPAGASGGSDEGSASYDPYYGQDRYIRLETDSAGRFETKVYEGYLNLNVWKDGYAHIYDDLQTDRSPIDLRYEMLKFPEKTAEIHGVVKDAGSGSALKWLSVSMESPQYGLYECSMYESDDRGYPQPVPLAQSVSADGAEASPDIAYYPYYPGCAITVHPDGSFTGFVTPGYTILNVWYDHWRSCTETHNADGSFVRDCGQDYYSHAEVIQLAPDGRTDIAVNLVPRPAPDAIVSGYVVDTANAVGIAGAQISFSNQRTYGYAWATTDEDGSYRLQVHSGFHSVSVWADGFLRWQGVIQIGPGGDTPFDVAMTEGRDMYGGCCYYRGYDEVVYEASDGGHAVGAPGVAQETAPSAPRAGSASAPGGGSDGDFVDLRGGLGPYNAAERARVLSSHSDEGSDSPGLGLLVLLGALAALVLVRRR